MTSNRMLDQLTSGWYFLLRMPLIPRTIEEAKNCRGDADNQLYAVAIFCSENNY